MSPRVHWKSFWLPKSGNSETEYEDSFDFARSRGVWRAAISDGASESAFARSWAKILATCYVEKPPKYAGDEVASLRSWLTQSQESWRDSIEWSTLPWYLAPKARQGAFSSLTGFQLRTERNAWSCWAVGDSCLFHVRGSELLRSFPIDNPELFTTRPSSLLSSMEEKNISIWRERDVQYLTGKWQPGDAFFLATDALAKHLLSEARAGMDPWPAWQCDDQEVFAQQIENKRYAGELKNDDATLVILQVSEKQAEA